MSFSGLDRKSVRDVTNDYVIVDAGALYVCDSDIALGSLTEGDFSPLGAIQGGATFEVNTDWRTIEIDGQKGDTKGAKIKESVAVNISADLMEHSLENYLKSLPGAVASDWPDSSPTHDLIERKTNVALSDYINYVALVEYLGEDSAVADQEPIIYIVKNALSQSAMSVDVSDGAEGLLPVEFTGHYDPSSPDTEPYAIAHPKDVTTPVLSTDGELVEGTTNPTLTLDLHYDDFASESAAENSANWTLTDDVDTDGATGLVLGTIYYHDDDTVTIEFDSSAGDLGTTDTGSISLKVTATALDGSEDTKTLKVSTVA